MLVPDSSPHSSNDAPKENITLEVHEEVQSVPVVEVGDGASMDELGPSWLRLGFQMPTEEEALRELASGF